MKSYLLHCQMHYSTSFVVFLSSLPTHARIRVCLHTLARIFVYEYVCVCVRVSVRSCSVEVALHGSHYIFSATKLHGSLRGWAEAKMKSKF